MKNGLAKTLDQLVARAEAHPGQPQRKPLTRGLRVDVLIKNDRTYLQISRDNAWPSPREWSIVLSSWPRPVPGRVASRRIFDQDQRRYYLKADWQTITAEQPELIQ
jgi:hypothetical protein